MRIRAAADVALLLWVSWLYILPVASSRAAEGSRSTPPSKAIEAAHLELQRALQSVRQHDTAEANVALDALIDTAEFAALDTSEQHVALSVAADSAMRLEQTRQAQEFAIRATALPEQTIDDWSLRWRAAAKLANADEEIRCATLIGRRWGAALTDNRDGPIFQALEDAKTAGLPQERLELMQLLFDLRWTVDAVEPSEPWRELTLFLLEKNSLAEAAQVAAHVTDPYQLIAMRADNRYRRVFKFPFVEGDVRKAAAREIENFRAAAHRQPRSLARLTRLLEALLHSGLDQQVLPLTDDVIRQVEASAPASMPYDDLNHYYWRILRSRSRALIRVGRYDEALTLRRRALAWPGTADVGYPAINLAALFCDLDRPREALSVLPSLDSSVRKTHIELTRLLAAVELPDAAQTDAALTYLRQHEPDDPGALQIAETIAGHPQEAVRVLLSRLTDPLLRSEALLELQDYARDPGPPRAMQWSAALKGMRDRSDARAAIAQVGRIDRYPLTSKWY